ncbi:MAG TPA: TetR family transcriptional regulator [Rhizomicrobium sp.]
MIILAAARKIIAQDSVEKFTLSAVAREAGLPRDSLYGSFHNKNELLLAIAADDLACASRSMRGDKSGPVPTPLPHGDLVEVLLGDADARARLPADTIFPGGADGLPPLADPPLALGGEVFEDVPPPQPGDPYEQMPSVARKRGEASQLHDIINRLTLPTTPLGEGSATALTRMDRRMSVMEKVFAELEGRFDKVEKLANDGLQTTETSLESLVQRAERTDRRISETATTLRGELLAAFTRMDPPKTEPPKVTLPPDEREYEIAISDIPPSEIAASEIEGVAAEVEPQGDLRSQLKHHTANDDYLSNARRSASEAAAVQAAPPQIKKRPRRRQHILSRNQLLGIGAISIAVILATMGIALSEGLLSAKAAPSEPAPKQAAHVQRTASIATPSRAIQTAPAAATPQAEPATPPARKLSPMERIEALANGGNTKAALIAGVKYLDGDGVARSEAEAARWLERAAKAGEPVAQYRLGTLYQRGAGVVQDEAQALRWYEASANQGNRKAMHNLGVFYAEGRGITQDYEKAASWFTRAANMGYVDSQFDLAVLYERGAGVPQNLSDAYKWYAIAAHGGDDVSKARIDVLETQLDPHELSAAKTAAHAFHAGPLSRAANMTPQLADLNTN